MSTHLAVAASVAPAASSGIHAVITNKTNTAINASIAIIARSAVVTVGAAKTVPAPNVRCVVRFVIGVRRGKLRAYAVYGFVGAGYERREVFKDFGHGLAPLVGGCGIVRCCLRNPCIAYNPSSSRSLCSECIDRTIYSWHNTVPSRKTNNACYEHSLHTQYT